MIFIKDLKSAFMHIQINSATIKEDTISAFNKDKYKVDQ